MLEQYRRSSGPSPPLFSCPACGHEHPMRDECPSCGLGPNAGPEDILIYKKFSELPDDKKIQFKSEEMAIFDPNNIMGVEERVQKFFELQKKFGLIA